MIRLILVNPNTSAATTSLMLLIAREAAGELANVESVTARFGSALIVDESALMTASKAVADFAPELRSLQPSGVIVSAFGDPGRDQLAITLNCPVTGIAEASMAEAAQAGRRFAVVTTTPALAASITRMVFSYGYGAQFAGTRFTSGDPVEIMTNPHRLEEELLRSCEAAIRDGAERIVIGGGPLAGVARNLRKRLSVELVEPIPAAVRLAIARCAPN